MATFKTYLIYFLCLMVAVRNVSSLECYNCTQVTNLHCKDYFTKKVPKVNCPPTELCTKHKQPASALFIDDHRGKNLSSNIIRGCRPINYCADVQRFSEHCSGCTTDLCNASYPLLTSYYILAISSTVLIGIYFA